MNRELLNQISRTSELEWKPLEEDGVTTKGLFVKVLRYDESSQRPPTFLLKFEPGASYPNHHHPAGEEVFVLSGEIRFGPDLLRTGDYLYTAPGRTHSAYSEKGCELLFVVPEEGAILK